jgi:hypothetical protein
MVSIISKWKDVIHRSRDVNQSYSEHQMAFTSERRDGEK